MSGGSSDAGEEGGSEESRERGRSNEAEEARTRRSTSSHDQSRDEGPDAAEGEGRKRGAEDDQTRRPISVRDLMPSPPSRPSRRPTERVERRERTAEPEPGDGVGAPEEENGAAKDEGAGELPEEAAEKTSAESAAPPPAVEEEEPAAEEGEPAGPASVPTPVRVAMEAPPPGDSRPPEELPSRRFEVEGEEWIVRISGRTITGSRPDPGALLMHLSFFRSEDPEDPRRRLITVDRPLDALYEEDLRELYERSRPTGSGSSGSE